MNIRIPNEPEYVGEIRGDRLYNAVTMDNINFVCRDWRYTEVSHQIHPPAAWKSPYLDRRRENVQNNGRIHRSLRELRGAYRGRSLYVILSGPSVIKNLQEHPPQPGDVIVGVNRGAIFSPYPLDFLLVADGVVTRSMIEEWGRTIQCIGPSPLSWEDKTRHTRLAMAQWADPSLKEMFGVDRSYFFRPSGLGHEASYTGLDLSLPELEYAFNTGSMTLHFGDYLGFTEIVLVGADMALTGNMFYPHQRATLKTKSTYLVLKDMNGFLTVTSNDMMVVSKKLETWAWLLKKYGVSCVNLTGEGIISRWFEKERMTAKPDVAETDLTPVPQLAAVAA